MYLVLRGVFYYGFCIDMDTEYVICETNGLLIIEIVFAEENS